MIFRPIEQLFVFWLDAHPVTDSEWNAMLAVVERHPTRHLKMLVRTLGGAPSPAQQLGIARLSTTKVFHGAVLSDSVGVRFAVSALALIIRRVRAFPANELEAAYAYLELSSAERRGADDFYREAEAGAPRARRITE